MKKNNFWNKLFHSKEIEANKKQYELCKKQLANAQPFITTLKNTKDLRNLLSIHKDLYYSGFEHPSIGPNEFGYFRCKSIREMTPHQVFLGDIYGLNTYAIPFWESLIDEPFGENGFGIDENKPLYDIILNQYRNILLNAVTAVYNKALQDSVIYEIRGY